MDQYLKPERFSSLCSESWIHDTPRSTFWNGCVVEEHAEGLLEWRLRSGTRSREVLEWRGRVWPLRSGSQSREILEWWGSSGRCPVVPVLARCWSGGDGSGCCAVVRSLLRRLGIMVVSRTWRTLNATALCLLKWQITLKYTLCALSRFFLKGNDNKKQC